MPCSNGLLALLQIDQQWRDAWTIFHKPAHPILNQKGEQIGVTDDSFRKLNALDRILKIQKLKIQLTGLMELTEEDEDNSIETVSDFNIDEFLKESGLSEEQRKTLIFDWVNRVVRKVTPGKYKPE